MVELVAETATKLGGGIFGSGSRQKQGGWRRGREAHGGRGELARWGAKVARKASHNLNFSDISMVGGVGSRKSLWTGSSWTSRPVTPSCTRQTWEKNGSAMWLLLLEVEQVTGVNEKAWEMTRHKLICSENKEKIAKTKRLHSQYHATHPTKFAILQLQLKKYQAN